MLYFDNRFKNPRSMLTLFRKDCQTIAHFLQYLDCDLEEQRCVLPPEGEGNRPVPAPSSKMAPSCFLSQIGVEG